MANKTIRLARIFAAAAGMAASMVTTASAIQPGGLAQRPGATRPGQFMTTSRPTIAPIAFAKFCEGAADQCIRIGDRDTVELTRQKRAELQGINAEINTSINYVSEQDGEDDWKLNPASGDCEDFAVTKRQRLLRAGWPSGALRIATARTSDGIGHAVLVVSTSQGDLVLDNRTNVVKPWKAVDLKWIKIQSHEDPRVWLKL
ncbi:MULTISPECIES: transglutaminase-like cysteine peptidase [unclassified Agrobacterium]|uniref:transglutaminase-like cysteine peptidase n=1 Tax=unclassified Agrobacterium TaxID=2632611 RepID=UPI002449C784|nr:MULTISPECIES: transglutaminase-like cysteine peptidase [unclassified Agrobacterium]MDH0612258.1 transglutaminase-like cysteine peptidase [Agrobacterium sp. GD03872]MDH0696155.1 transglutaminase-like cysteine peptidase [Agrobacterium sp. GD03871]MDH1059057.1 transglutaminase-like cysteine peptidase [Agrobacterium sp. GD03992]MDH2210419.1 transglutaminase-like cysteine peptidase [Agrobacterium sp. GD03643]MDH2217922.1 transglutaminase-like cysteine peptidase [Agrobacterium sp. GD03638]